MPARSGGRQTSYRFADVGLHFAATIGVFTYAGYWADSSLGTRPWLLIAGVFLGFGLGMVSMLAKIAKLSSNEKPKPAPAESSMEDKQAPAHDKSPPSNPPPNP